jgi:hypothetical protein
VVVTVASMSLPQQLPGGSRLRVVLRNRTWFCSELVVVVVDTALVLLLVRE